ncbi:50S ribosomal protein L4 [Mycoplasma sp. CSL10137]|uniref:50S ribosomal protein L4 n=1 Tax=unclassified Mycoplasma TaxID=2683645 RepID=UPI00197BABD8|nr:MULTISPECIES: 50S ribosomal protein L4 [unclassified Mycoplasma]MBN4083845.1 50S ribosomal protein L4 [Mycoplasma sp. CSL10137]MBN4084196.1 50S ribosomal protein L4 [Mycoplasma sp. CSL10166]MBU4692657.1 50S ribosomal protein L4 [Mycoplasma sp. CSL7491-lung]
MAETKKAKVEKETTTKTTKKPAAKKTTTTTKKPAAKKTETKKVVAKKEKEVKTTTTTKKVVKKVLKSEVKLPKALFQSEKIYEQAIFDTILSERASRRQGTHQVKNRAEVSGSGKKPWRQKGTGRARHSSMRSPIWVGGGRAFGPQSNKNYSLKVNKKVKYNAFVSALTLLSQDNAVIVDDLTLNSIKTKDLVNKLVELNVNDLRHVLVVNEDYNVFKSAKNLPNVATTKANSLTVEEIVGADVMIISKQSLELLERKAK